MSFRAIASRLDAAWQDYLEAYADEKQFEPLPKANRGSWFCPCVNLTDVKRYKDWLERLDIQRVYDMGAGDLRLSYYLADRGYDVVAYETLPDVIKLGTDNFGPPTFELRQRDYYRDFRKLTKEGMNVSFAFFGATNRVPWIPQQLMAEGYWEKGTRVWLQGRKIEEW
jgi:SAM-dependent methyltransferase